MSFADAQPSFAPPPLVHWGFRPLGTDAIELQDSVSKAFDPTVEHREVKILFHLFDVVRKSSGVSVITFNRALSLLKSLPSNIPLPFVCVESKDEIGLDWDEGGEKVVNLVIDTSPEIGFVTLLKAMPSYGTVEYRESSHTPPGIVQFLLEHVYSSARD